MKKTRRRQIEPLPEAVPIWKHPSSTYPDLLRVSFENGQTRLYAPVSDWKPLFLAEESGRFNFIGYHYKPEKEKHHRL